MNYTSKLLLRPIPALFTIVLSLAILLGMPSQASAAATYGADDYYLLVKSCTGTSCMRDAAWGPHEAQLQRLFKQQGWGKDPAIASHNPGSTTSWSSWATAFADTAIPRSCWPRSSNGVSRRRSPA